MLTQTIILSATKYTVKPTVYMMQGDTGRALACAFADFTVPEGATARLYIHRPNGTFYTETATIDGQVVNVEADQVVTTAGYVNCDLEIEANNETVQSFPFTVRVLATEAGSPQTTEKGVSVAELDERVTALENAPQGAAWGEITGTLADQTDLKNALDGKANGTVYGYDPNTDDATIGASGKIKLNAVGGITTTTDTQEFRSVTDSPEHGYSLKIDATDGLKKGTLDAETGEWTYEEIGGGGSAKKYQHNIHIISSTFNTRFSFSFINDSSTPYDSVSGVSSALKNAGFDDGFRSVLSNGIYYESSNYYLIVCVYSSDGTDLYYTGPRVTSLTGGFYGGKMGLSTLRSFEDTVTAL